MSYRMSSSAFQKCNVEQKWYPKTTDPRKTKSSTILTVSPAIITLSVFFVITSHLTEFTLATHFVQAFSMFFVDSFSLVHICEITVVSCVYGIYGPVEPEIGSGKGQPGGIPPIGIREISIKKKN